jgi:putative restriction endonuclease
MRRAWLALAFGDERQHAGNKGYEDELSRHYRYDTFVPNHTQVAPGDLLVLRDASEILGVALVNEITERAAKKLMLRCPRCHTTALKERKFKLPRYRCGSCRFEFDEPERTTEDCTEFSAEFHGHFVPVRVSPLPSAVRDACPRYNGQLAIQEIRLDRLPPSMAAVTRVARTLLDLPLPGDAATEDNFEPTGVDERERVARQIIARRGQRGFRSLLRAKHGSCCVVSGCGLVDLLEAAHISPYRGKKDNHGANGILLRADLHTLFDLDLLAIESTSMRVRLHPDVIASGYAHLEGRELPVSCADLSASALEERWARFLARLHRPSFAA